MNIEFSDRKTSPLTDNDFANFTALNFFPIDSTYRVYAHFELNENPRLFQMKTTTDEMPLYKAYGIATFELNGQNIQLQVYQNQELITKPGYKNHLFIPFMDATNTKESYGGGRYLDLEKPKNDTLLIDFNKAYNPYCAYNDKYSCPIPPRENHLDIAIKAGIKTFKKQG
tara:strand:+ start:93461 stop:93970 length:510 start_codon:yes stop_codon:yes gene_type:complete